MRCSKFESWWAHKLNKLGVGKLVIRVVWDHEFGGSSPSTLTKTIKYFLKRLVYLKILCTFVLTTEY